MFSIHRSLMRSIISTTTIRRNFTIQLPAINVLRDFANQHSDKKQKTSDPVKLLIIDGYTPEGREQLVQGGASTAGELYSKMMNSSSPKGAECTIIYPADSDKLDVDLSEYDGVGCTGCSLSSYDDIPEVKRQIELQKQIYSTGIPSFGSCWGLQIATIAAGGHVAPNPRGREMGIARKIKLTAAGRAHPMYEGKPDVFDAYTSHEDEVTHIPLTTEVLSTNQHSRVQSLAITHQGSSAWGVQYHPEYDLHELAMLLNCRIERLTKMGFFATHKDAEQVVKDWEMLHYDPSRKDLAWKYAIDSDTMNEDIRLIETRNWIKKVVTPYQEWKRIQT